MKSVFAGFVAVLMGTPPALALDGPGRALIAANTEQIANDPVQTATNNAQVGRTFIPPYSGTLRVKWDIKSKDGTEVFGDVFVSHLSDCSKSSTSMSYVTQSCDLRVTGGMPVNLVAAASQASNTVYLKNVSLNYKIVDSDGNTIPYESPRP
jgi:hypothetical protein